VVNLKLVEYIKKEAEKGYSYDIIRNYLINYGYGESEISQAVSYIQNPNEVLEKHLLGKLIKDHIKLLLISFILVFVIIAAFLFSPIFQSGKESYFRPVIANKILEQGEPLIINIDYENLEGEVLLQIIKNGDILFDKNIPLIKEQQEISISVSPGDYEVNMRTNGFSKQEYIRIVERGVTGEDITSITERLQEREESRRDIEVEDVSPQNGDGETGDKALNISQTVCRSLEATYYDVCLDDNARITKDPNLCMAINDKFRREACVMRLVSEINDYSLCEKLTIEQFVKLCRQLERTKQQLSSSEERETTVKEDEAVETAETQLAISNIVKNVFGNTVVFRFNTSREASPVVFYDTNDAFLENQRAYGLNTTHEISLGPLEKGKYFFKIKVDSLETDTDSFVIN